MSKPTRHYSNSQEEYLAKLLNGTVQSNSGGTKFGGGDVHTKSFLIEAKTPTKPQKGFSIKKDWIIKAEEQAFQQRKRWGIVAFEFEPGGENYFVLPETLFKIIVECEDAE